jgi:hypothetical protein
LGKVEQEDLRQLTDGIELDDNGVCYLRLIANTGSFVVNFDASLLNQSLRPTA